MVCAPLSHRYSNDSSRDTIDLLSLFSLIVEKLDYNLRYRSAGPSSKFKSSPSLLSIISVIHRVSSSFKYKSYSSLIGPRAFMTEQMKY